MGSPHQGVVEMNGALLLAGKIKQYGFWLSCKKAAAKVFRALFRRNTIGFLVVVSGQKCTLHCKNCSNFSPYHSRELDFYDADKIIADIERILKKTKRIECLQFQGGDFFLHKDVDKMLDWALRCRKVKTRTVATNAVIIPKPSTLAILKAAKFTVRISDYGSANSVAVEKLVAVLKENRVPFFHHRYANGDLSWSYLGGIGTPKQTDDDTAITYSKCVFRGCLTLEDGIISRCSRATVAHKVQGFTPLASDFVDVRGENFSIRDLRRFIKCGWKPATESAGGGGL